MHESNDRDELPPAEAARRMRELSLDERNRLIAAAGSRVSDIRQALKERRI